MAIDNVCLLDRPAIEIGQISIWFASCDVQLFHRSIVNASRIDEVFEERFGGGIEQKRCNGPVVSGSAPDGHVSECPYFVIARHINAANRRKFYIAVEADEP